MDASNRRIVILGKTGVGKSSLANTIFGGGTFMIDDTANSGTRRCEAETKSVNGRSITLIDTPGFFDTGISEDELRPEIVRCITECAPGPHAFLIVLKVERFTELEQAVINRIIQYFSEEAFRYATVVFTHGDQLRNGQTIEDFFRHNELFSDLMKKCGGRCHVVDNRCWNQEHEYRSNQFQVEELLKTIDRMVMENNGNCYTSEILKLVEEEIEQEEEKIRLLPGNMSEEEIREQAKDRVFKKLLIKLTGVAVGVLLGAFFGVVVMVGAVATVLRESSEPVQLRGAIAKTAAVIGGNAIGAIGGAAAGGAAGVTGTTVLALTGAAAVAGAVKGGMTGYDASEGADTPKKAAKRACEAVKNEAQSLLNKADSALNGLSQTKQRLPL